MFGAWFTELRTNNITKPPLLRERLMMAQMHIIHRPHWRWMRSGCPFSIFKFAFQGKFLAYDRIVRD